MVKFYFLFFFLFLFCLCSYAQIPVAVTNASNASPALASSYSSFAAALTALNSRTLTGAIGFTLTGGNSETAPIKGFILGSATLNPSLSATNKITITRTSGIPVINAGVGNSTPGSASPDGMLVLNGADYVTIKGISFVDGNTTNPATMEFGIGMFKLSANDGCNHNTIQSCSFSMQRINNASGGGPMPDGATAIAIVNSVSTAAVTTLTTGSVAGANSFNRIYSNSINGGNTGIAVIGYAAPSPYTLGDQSNEVGASGEGNNIVNYGGGGTANPAAGVRTLSQYGLTVYGNNINNNNGSGVSHATTLRGIYTNTAAGATETVSNNIINVTSGASTSQLSGIENSSGTLGGTVTITNNKDTVNYPGATSGASYAIYNTIAVGSLAINSNTIAVYNACTSGNQYCVFTSGSTTTAINILSNTITANLSGITSATLMGIRCSGAGTSCAMAINSNIFNGFNYTNAATTASTGSTYGIFQSGTPLTEEIKSNQFVNLSIKTKGFVNLISNTYSAPSGGSKNVTNNIISGFVKRTGDPANGDFYCYFDAGSSPAGVTHFISNNNFSNISTNSTTNSTTFFGFYSVDGLSSTPGLTFTNNTISNVACEGSDIRGFYLGGFTSVSSTPDNVSGNTVNAISSSGSGVMVGMYILPSSSAYVNVYDNLIDTLSGNGGGTMYGIYNAGGNTVGIYSNIIHSLALNGSGSVDGLIFTGGTTLNVYKNKLYDIYHTTLTVAVVTGVNFQAGTTVNFYNNLIGDLRNTSNTASFALVGAMINTQIASAIKAYNNTIYLNATPGGSGFSSACIYHVSSATAFTNMLDLRNNIFVNNSPIITGTNAVAFARSAATLANYATTSNNNLLYAGTPGTGHIIYYDGTTSYTTLASFKTAVTPRETNSVTENPTFITTNGALNTFLHFDPATTTLANNGGTPVALVTDDYDYDLRSATTPDIGADEITSTKVRVQATLGTSVLNYDDVRLAFNAINAGTHRGILKVTVFGDPVETAGASLNGSGSGSASYSSISFSPLGNRTVSGNINGSLISLLGVANMKIDGINNSLSSLVINNPNTGGASGVRFTQGASNDTIQNCTILSAGTTSFVSGGIVLPGGGSSTAVSDILIKNNNIGPSGSTPFFGIWSNGASSSVPNYNIKVINNNIYDFFNDSYPGLRGAGISMDYDSAWTISGNRFYQTTPRSTTASASLYGIYLLFGGGNTISGNTFGYADANGTGVTEIDGGLTFYALLDLADNSPTPTYVTNNVVAGLKGTLTAPANGIFYSNLYPFYVSGRFSITGNVVGSASQNGSISLNTSAGESMGLTCINYASGTPYGTISNNRIAGIDMSTTTGNITFLGIRLAGTNFDVYNNSIGSSLSNSISMGTAGSSTGNKYFYGILVDSAKTDLTIYNDTLQNITFNYSGGGTEYGFSATRGLSSSCYIQNNIVQNIKHPLTNNAFSYWIDVHMVSNPILYDVSGNVVDNISGNCGTRYLIDVIPPASSFYNCVGNKITNISSTASNSTYGLYVYAAGSTSGTISNTGIKNLSSPGGYIQALYVNSFGGAAAVADVHDNVVSAVTGSSVYGIYNYNGKFYAYNDSVNNLTGNSTFAITSGSSGGGGIYKNVVSNLSATSSGYGLSVSNSGGDVYNNKITEISVSGTGFAVGLVSNSAPGGNGTTNIYNNLIGNFIPASANQALSWRGMWLRGASSDVIRAYHNTINFSGTGLGTNFGSAGVYIESPPALSMYNNIIVNTSVPLGTGKTAAIVHSASTFNTLSADNNILYAGTPSASNIIFYDGTSTSDITINRYRYRVGPVRQANSKTELPPFLSTVSTSANFLHIDPAVTNFESNAGANVGTATDYDDDVRTLATPDIGADEFTNTVPQKDADAPVITLNAGFTAGCNASRTFTATITDATGIPLSGATIPRIYFNKNSGAYVSTAATFVSGTATNSTWSFNLDPLLLGGVTAGDVVNYYITAQDIILPQPNIGANTPGGFYADDVNTIVKEPAAPVNFTVTAVLPYDTWLGINNDWFDASNWCGGVPLSTTNVNIPGSLSKYPIITTGSALAQNVSIAAGGSITVTGAGIFSLNGTVSNSGTFDLTDGTLELASAAASVGGGSIASATVKKLLLSNSASIPAGTGNMMKVSGDLAFSNVSFKTLTTNGNLTLLSSASGTASFNDMTNNNVNSNNSISGDVTVERYIPANRKWRFLSIPTTTTQSVRDSWMEGAADISQNPLAGYGTIVTDEHTNALMQGFDAQSVSGPSIKYYVPATNTYTGISSPSVGINTQRSYFNFVRGNRTSLPSNNTLSSTILRTTGTLKQNTLSVNVASNTIEAVGNPYASRIDLRKLSLSNMASFVYIWDPQLTSPLGYGAFQVLSFDGMDYRILTGGGSYGAANSIVNTIESSQGFFMKAGSGGGTVQFTEPAKTSGSSLVYFAPGVPQSLTALLSVKQDTTRILMDGCRIDFKNTYSAAADINDADKLSNFHENVSIAIANKLLSIERRPEPEGADTVQLNLGNLRLGDYEWKLLADNMDAPGRGAWLGDRYLNIETALNLTGNTLQHFTVSNVAGSYAANRFYIVFKPTTVVPVHFTYIRASRAGKGLAEVRWQTENEINIAAYEVQRSVDGMVFNSITQHILPLNNSGGSAGYLSPDENVSDAENFYRVKAIGNDGLIKYSAVAKIPAVNEMPALTIQPNLVRDNIVRLSGAGLAEGTYRTRIINTAGQTLLEKDIRISGRMENFEIRLFSKPAAGSYSLEMISNSGEKYSSAFSVMD